MSPVTPTKVAHASLAGVSSLLNGISGPSPLSGPIPPVIDFNGTVSLLPAPAGPNRVGVHDYIVQYDMDEVRQSRSARCENATEASMSHLYGDVSVSYYREACSGSRHVPVSMFYPTCGSNGRLLNYSTVFPDSLLSVIQDEIFGDAKAVHNLGTQVLLDAPVCPGAHPLIILTPPMGSQRQVYSQTAGELAAEGNVVVTVDHPLLSGVVELAQNATLFNVAGEIIQPEEGLNTMVSDVKSVAAYLVYAKQHSLPSWIWPVGARINPQKVCVYGHGSGGQAAQMLQSSTEIACGGRLDGHLRIPAPYPDTDVLYQPRHNKSSQVLPDEEENLLDNIEDPAVSLRHLFQMLKTMAQGIQKRVVDSLVSMGCRIMGNCNVLVEKRGSLDNPQDYYDFEPYDLWEKGDEKSCFEDCHDHHDACEDEEDKEGNEDNYDCKDDYDCHECEGDCHHDCDPYECEDCGCRGCRDDCDSHCCKDHRGYKKPPPGIFPPMPHPPPLYPPPMPHPPPLYPPPMPYPNYTYPNYTSTSKTALTAKEFNSKSGAEHDVVSEKGGYQSKDTQYGPDNKSCSPEFCRHKKHRECGHKYKDYNDDEDHKYRATVTTSSEKVDEKDLVTVETGAEEDEKNSVKATTDHEDGDGGDDGGEDDEDSGDDEDEDDDDKDEDDGAKEDGGEDERDQNGEDGEDGEGML